MPGADRVIDPITKDYVDNGAGSWKTTTTIATAVYHQLQGELNAWAGDSEAGSRFYQIKRAPNNDRIRQMATDFVRTALQVFIAKGLAADLKVETVRLGTNQAVTRSFIRDVQSGANIDLNPLMPFGV